jgi:hypothetical protein
VAVAVPLTFPPGPPQQLPVTTLPAKEIVIEFPETVPVPVRLTAQSAPPGGMGGVMVTSIAKVRVVPVSVPLTAPEAVPAAGSEALKVPETVIPEGVTVWVRVIVNADGGKTTVPDGWHVREKSDPVQVPETPTDTETLSSSSSSRSGRSQLPESAPQAAATSPSTAASLTRRFISLSSPSNPSEGRMRGNPEC